MRHLWILFLALLSACLVETKEVTKPAKRVLVMYDNIDDAVGRPFTANVAAAQKAVKAGALDAEERVVVFHRRSGGSTIYEVTTKGEVVKKKYADGVNADLSPEIMASVMSDIRAMYPDAVNWGMAFGSHGLGWIPKDYKGAIARSGVADPFGELWQERQNPKTRFFQGYGRRLDVGEFVDALDEWKWDFIILDDCFMASIEALYQMRALADIIIASPTEIMLRGFPYDRVVKTIFADWSNVAGIGREFIDYYNAQASTPCATVAVVKMSGIEPLARSIKALGLTMRELSSITGIQVYDGYSTPGHIFYDLRGFLRARGGFEPAYYQSQLALFEERLAGAIIYAGHTPTFYTDYGPVRQIAIDAGQYSGLNVFIPWQATAPLWDMYRQTPWYSSVYL